MASLEKVKRDGAIKGLIEHIDDRLWAAKLLIESAGKDDLASLPSDIGNVKTCLDEALAAWKEREALRKKPSSEGAK